MGRASPGLPKAQMLRKAALTRMAMIMNNVATLAWPGPAGLARPAWPAVAPRHGSFEMKIWDR